MIEVAGITKLHGREVVLDDVSLTVGAGTQLALIGPGGAGKSLLIKIMAALVRPERGTVHVNGEDMLALNDVELARARASMGMLFQNYALFDFMTVEENIAFPLRQAGKLGEGEITERVAELLHQVDLPGIQKQYPRELSGGMKKRVTFARAVIHEPPLLFYDDPTAGLDPVTSSKIFILLDRMKRERGVTSVVITHDILGVRDICDEFVLLNHGRVVFRGTRDEIESSEVRFVQQFWRGESDE
ncbi:MAG: ATP-binding cassette domain-containing protein [Myxococcales bacterium]|nr:ATP-binding cassette domain-containing protein [Myxococcales bacterium]MCB9530495.1 ATP-binding cassette domain-containing protein [Myxococcales bacterium]MCB9533447.1 ATP-binding cassette domain-containing protein [Myxococcales bacterium]